MDLFLSCDWGTSSFRLRLVQRAGAAVVAEEANSDGIAVLFKTLEAPAHNRLAFYQSYLHGQMKKLEAKVGYSLQALPLLVSGMASSSIGMVELPYKRLPFRADGGDLMTQAIPPSTQLPNHMLIVSGAATGDDVMRGEETILAGCEVPATGNGLYIFPGTHSKQVQVREGVAHHFKTYMTGEVFELLAAKSILASSVTKNEKGKGAADSCFEKGILEGATANLLNSAFHVRTASLFKQHTPEENYHYLSGLVIGAELKALQEEAPAALFLVSGKGLAQQYEQGLRVLGLDKNLQLIDADRAFIKGQLRIWESMGF